MSFRLVASPLARTNMRMVSAIRPAAAINSRVFFHASRVAKEQSSSNITDVYKAPVYKQMPVDQVHGSYHWDFERLLSVSMIPLFAASAYQGAHPITDGLLGVVVPIHAHMGWDAMITDYLHPGKVGVVGNKVASWSLRGMTVLVLVGCYQFNTADVGLTELVKSAWTA